MHLVKIKGYITSIGEDRMTLNAYNIEKLKHVLASYGEVAFVPFIDKLGVKVKYGKLTALAKIHGKNVRDYVAEYDGNVVVVAKIRKNTFGDSTSITLMCQNISVQ